MKPLFAVLLLVAAFAVSGCAPAGMDASLQIRSAPPPPSVQFNDEPRFNYLSDRRVYTDLYLMSALDGKVLRRGLDPAGPPLRSQARTYEQELARGLKRRRKGKATVA